MKYVILILLLLLVLPEINANRIDLLINQSYTKEGRNVTLIDISKDKALFCVNNEKAIIVKDKQKTLNDVNFELKRVYEDRVKVDIKFYCKDCKCDLSCSNIDCLNLEEIKIQEEIKKEDKIEEAKSKELDIEIINNEKSNNNAIIASIIILLLIIILYFLLRKK